MSHGTVLRLKDKELVLPAENLRNGALAKKN